MELVGLDKKSLESELSKLGEKSFRTKQIWQWLYFRGAKNFDEMTNLSKDLRENLKKHFTLTRLKIITEQRSEDKTHKWLLEFGDGQRVETVFIPEEDRGAVCVSSQVGCAMGCAFCNTGTQKIVRNLTAAEIIGQVMIVRDTYGEWAKVDNKLVSNIVVMGMGEPLLNMENMIQALNILTDQDGFAFSRRKITLSTVGITPNIVPLVKATGVKLAISLHAPNDEIRKKIIPIAKKYPIEELLKACQEYQKLDGSRHITFEYLMLKGINDKLEYARELVRLMKKYKLGAKFNLIAFNPWPGCSFESSPRKYIEAFASEIRKGGFEAPIRASRGQDILAACGQLKSQSNE